MARLRVIEADQSTLSANPWEEELREREGGAEEEEERKEEKEKQIPASQRIPSSKRSTLDTPNPPTQKGLALIFGKVDHQIDQLDKQLSNVQTELLKTRAVLMSLGNTFSNLNKPEASERLEIDAFTNYLRISDRLKAIAEKIFLILPKIPRHPLPTRKTYNNEVVYGGSNLGGHDPESPLDDPAPYSDDLELNSRHEPGPYSEQTRFSELAFDVGDEGDVYEQSARESSAYASDKFFAPSRRGQKPTKPLHSEGPRFIRQSSSLTYDRKRGSILRNSRTVHYAPTFRSSSSSITASGSLVYDNLTESSQLEDSPNSMHVVRSGSLESASSSRRRFRSSFSHPDSNATELGESLASLAREESQVASDEPRIVLVEPKGAQALSLEATLQEERTFLLEKLHEVQDQLQAAQSIQAIESTLGNGNEVESDSIKGNLWTRLKRKFTDHSNKQGEHDIAK
jgi:hypothetical protein